MYDIDCPGTNPEIVLLIVAPLPASVSAVISFVLLNVTVIPSVGFAGIVIVPVANVAAGFIINTLYALNV
jgi:hypothetical protein